MFQRLRHAVGWGSSSVIGMHMSGGQSRVDFQVHAQLGHGESLYVVGDAAGLGNALSMHIVDASHLNSPLSLPSSGLSFNAPSPGAPVLKKPFSDSGEEVPPELKHSLSSGMSAPTVSSCRLVTTPEMYPLWYNAEPVVLNSNTNLTYRYAVCSNGKFVRYESFERSSVVAGDSHQVVDVLDQNPSDVNLNERGDQHRTQTTVVPRLSSGQAFVDRRAVCACNDRDNIGISLHNSHRGSKRGTLLQESYSIPEGDEDATETKQAAPKKYVIEEEASNPLNQGGIGLGQRRRTSGNYSLHSPRHKEVGDATSANSTTSPISPQNVTIQPTDGVIIVVHRLPVLVTKIGDGEYHIDWEDDNLLCPSGLIKDNQSNGLLYRDGTASAMRLTWVGMVHCNSVIPKADEEKLARQLQAYHCVPVFIDPVMSQTFHSFCYGTLWPIVHNIVDVYGKLPTRWWNPSQQKNAWSSYMHVNRIFVNKVIEVYNEGDLVWVHGLHLLVAPSFLSRRLPYVNVGLFLHTPFPSSEIFRTLSVRADLLRGMLSSDHIGFHLYEHARHFLTSCRRILGLKYNAQAGGYIGVEYNGRMVAITISHIGIEPPFVDRLSMRDRVVEETARLRALYGKKKIIVGVDQVERLKGINLKMLSLEQFFLMHPQYRDTVQVMQFGIVDASDTSEAKLKLRKEIQSIVDRINATYPQPAGTEPLVVYRELHNTDLSIRLPLWNVADVMLLTSVRDAVSLYPFEFVYAHNVTKRPGVVIVSEFSGSSRVLTGSLGVNPWKKDEVVEALVTALEMPEEEKAARHAHDFDYIVMNTRTKWAERILVDLKRTSKASSTVGMQYMGYGLGLGYRMLEFHAGFKMLETDQVVRAYRHTFRRVLLFDYGNTLAQEHLPQNNFSKYIKGDEAGTTLSGDLRHDTPKASPELLTALSKLCSDPRNTVFVLSGKDRQDLEKTLGAVRGLGLAAEHGYLYRWGDNDDGWLCTKENFDDSWKDITHSVMAIYTQRTHGTYIEVKGSALLWQYRDADPEFGQLQAKELHEQLLQVLESYQVEVLPGNDYLEVRPEGVDKGVMVDRILSTLESRGGTPVDYVLCIGDDLSDEFMFSYLEERNLPKTFTVTVGKKPSAAKHFLNDVDQVMEILNALTKVTTTSNRNLSMNDLRTMDHRYVD
ncbi:trehalose-phosphatase, variant [Aphanomyces invadans]|uniref:Trehalose-phosphatase, variant n=1 Tax=Aphanomyces invadans TaxID=157072 RepID=A0A024UQF7_9STRA|nr:trehalose-phosphatase, variant [Aphanomyces invadans]ETW08519.1 trehalose-phosphatase, variant [Aphanomyces invadans]|eukprot:XP_008862324.1 trehalose-phosphatase, variant [Aphanomyces invadans]